APRAWPSLSADIALLDRNTCSTATSSGAYSPINAHSPSSSMRRRSGKDSAPSRLSGWWCTWVTLPSAATSMMPTPVRCEPGSMPRMRVTSRIRVGAGDSLRRRAEIGVVRDVLHVVQVLQPPQQLLHLLCGFAVDRRIVVGAHGHFGEAGRQPRRLHRRLDVGEGLRRGQYVD